MVNKWYGEIGFSEGTVETEPGIWEEQIVRDNYFGDIVSNYRNIQNSNVINDDINVAVKISVVADPFAMLNFHKMRYVEYMGTKWRATSVEPQYPRLIITLGGAWHDGEQT